MASSSNSVLPTQPEQPETSSTDPDALRIEPRTRIVRAMFVFALVVAAAIAAIVVTQQWRLGALKWDWGATFILALGWASQFPNVVAKLSGERAYRRDNQMRLVSVIAPANPTLVLVCQVVAVGVAALLLLNALHRPKHRRISYFGVAVIVASLIAMIADLSAYVALLTGQPMILLIVLMAAAFATPSRDGAIAGAALFVISICVVGAMLAIYDRAAVVMACDGKCTIAGEIYMGPTTHGNTLGLITAAGLPFVWLAFNGRARYILVAFTLFNLIISGSRTSLIVGLLTLLVLMATNPKIKNGIVSGKRLSVLTITVVASVAISIILPLTARPDSFATGRGYLWRIALEQFERQPVLGSGLTVWNQFYKSGEFNAAAAYSTHNQWVEILLLSGVVGAFAFAAGFAVLIFIGSANHRFVVLAVLLPIAALGITERPLSLGLINSMTWALVSLVAVSSITTRTAHTDPSKPHSVETGKPKRQQALLHQQTTALKLTDSNVSYSPYLPLP